MSGFHALLSSNTLGLRFEGLALSREPVRHVKGSKDGRSWDFYTRTTSFFSGSKLGYCVLEEQSDTEDGFPDDLPLGTVCSFTVKTARDNRGILTLNRGEG